VPERTRGRPVLGVDLAGAPGRTTGCCALYGRSLARCSVIHTDEELRSLVDGLRPSLIIVDAPLSLPRGRATIDDRSGPHLRACDRELLRRRIRFFPITLGPMRMLTTRGMRIAAELRAERYEVVEGYPGASQDLLGLPRKQQGLSAVRRGLRALGVRGDLYRKSLTHDELDAITIAWVGREHRLGRSLVIGDPSEGTMVLPRPRQRRTRGRGSRSKGRGRGSTSVPATGAWPST
jgi:uncharacterized protein